MRNFVIYAATDYCYFSHIEEVRMAGHVVQMGKRNMHRIILGDNS